MPKNRQNINVKKWSHVAHDVSHRKKIKSAIYPGDCLRSLSVYLLN